MWGARGRALSYPRPLVPSGVRPGPTTHWLWVRGVRAWEPVTNPTARALASWLCALWGRHEGAWGGHLLPGCGASGVGRSPTPDVSSVRACGRGPLPTGCGCGGCGHGDPLETPQRALLLAGFARCGRGMRVPRGGAPCLGAGRPGTGALPPTTSRQFGRSAGAHPLPTGCGCRGCGRGDPSPTPQRALMRASFARCGGGMSVPRGGTSCLGVGRPGMGALPPPTSLPFGRAAGAHYPLVVGAGGAGVGTRHQPHSARSCVLWGRHEGAQGGRLLPGCGASGVGRSPTADHSSFQACGRNPLPTGCGCGGCGCGDPSPTPQRALLRAGFARCGGGTRALGGGAACLGFGLLGTGALPPLTTHPFGRVAGARFPLAMSAVCGHRGPAVLGTLSRAAVRRVLCALPGFAALGGPCGLAPVLVPWLWPAACLSGVPRGPVLVRRSSSGPVALGAPVGSPVAVVPSPTPGAVAPYFTGWLRGARRGRPRTGLIVPAACPCRGKGTGRALRRTRSGPSDRVVPGGSLRLRSWAACAAMVWRVWTQSLTLTVSCTVCLATGDSAGAPGLFRVEADTAPFRSEDATPRSRACVRVRALPGRVGRVGLSGAFWCDSPFLRPFLVRSLLVRPPPGWGCPVCGCCCFYFFSFIFFPFLSVRPVVSRFACFPAWALAPCCPPPFSLHPPLCAPLSPALRVFRPGVLWALASCCPPLLLFFSFAPPSLLSLAFPAFRLPWASAPPPPFFFISPFFAGCLVRGGFVCLGRWVCPRVPRWCCPCRCSVCAG